MRQTKIVSLLLLFTTALPVLADTPDEQYKYASELYAGKLYSLASQSLKKFLDANPAHPQAKIAAYQYAAAIYRTDKNNQGPDYASAAAAYESALQKYGDAPANIVSAARFELGEAYFFQDKPDKAIAPLVEFLKAPGAGQDATDKAAWANYYIGKGRQELKDFKGAKSVFERIRDNYADSDPPASDALMELGIMALDENKPAEAVTSFQGVINKYGKSEAASEARVRLADALAAAGKPDEARAAYKAALADPKASSFKADLLLGQAGVDFAQKNWSDAAQGYSQVLGALKADDKRRNTIQLRLGNSHYNAKNYDAAVAAYAPITGSKDAALGANALYFTAASQFAQKKFSEAANNYGKVVENFPASDLAPKAALRMGDAWEQAKNPVKAAEAYKIVLTKYEKSEPAKDAQAALADLAGSAGSAIESVIRDLPGTIIGGAKLQLAQAAFDKEEWTKAAQLAQGVADAKPDDATREGALNLVARAKLSAKDAGAAEAFRKQITAFPKGKLLGEAKLGLAWALEDQEKWADAESAARDAVAALNGDLKDNAQLTLARVQYYGGKNKEAATSFAAVENATDKAIAAQAVQGGAFALEKEKQWQAAANKWAKYAGLVAEPKAKSEALLHQGLALSQIKNNGAIAAFDAAIVADPKGDFAAEALYESAWHLQEQKSPDAAARWARLEREFPNSKRAGEALYQQGEVALAAKKWDEAAVFYRRAAEKDAQSDLAPRAQYQLGTALYNAEKWADAATAFDKAATAKKEAFAPEAPYWAADSYRRAGKLPEAATRYETFVTTIEANNAAPAELKTYLPSARLGWGQSVTDPVKAATIYQAALAKAEGAAKGELQFRLGEALFKQNKHADAAPLLSLASLNDKAPWAPQAEWLAAQALENTGAKSDALVLYRKLAARQPANDLTAKAQEKVKALE
jgi:TolA-binding protein